MRPASRPAAANERSARSLLSTLVSRTTPSSDAEITFFSSNHARSATALGLDVSLLFTGTVLGLVIAYVVRFHALSYLSVEARMGRIDRNLDVLRTINAERATFLGVGATVATPGTIRIGDVLT